MSNNSVDLSGYLAVAKAGTLPVGRSSVPLVEGWITTGLPLAGGRHPFAAFGDPAEAILRQAQGGTAPPLPGERLGVSVRTPDFPVPSPPANRPPVGSFPVPYRKSSSPHPAQSRVVFG